MDHFWAGLTAFLTTVGGFIVGQIEPLPGVILAAIGGSVTAAMVGDDRPFRKTIGYIVLGVVVGIAVSQMAELFWTLKPHVRVGVAAMAALFAEPFVGMVHRTLDTGSLTDLIAKIMPWGGGKK